MRIDPEQRFACSQCGRCCHRFDVFISATEVDLYQRKGATTWFHEGSTGEPFEPVAEIPGFFRIRKRADGACGFLSDTNLCRIHEELGAAKKPLTCRVFPYSFHPTADGIVVKASFGCPTIVANAGPLSGAGDSLIALESLRKEWFATNSPPASPRLFVKGRTITARSSRLLRDHLIEMLNRKDADIRTNISRVATTIDDLTRSRVVSLPDDDFAEYLALTVPHAAAKTDAPPARTPAWNARLLQFGFLYAVTAIRAESEHRGASRSRLRWMRLRLLAHFHGVAPPFGRVDIGALKRRRVDINDPAIRAIVFHYLRSTIETLGVERPLVDDLNIAASFLNAAVGLAKMNADAIGHDVDRAMFSEALSEAADVSHARNGLLDWALNRLGGTSDALHQLATAT